MTNVTKNLDTTESCLFDHLVLGDFFLSPSGNLCVKWRSSAYIDLDTKEPRDFHSDDPWGSSEVVYLPNVTISNP